MEPSQDNKTEQPFGIYVEKDVLGQEKAPDISMPEHSESNPEPDNRPSRIYMVLAVAIACIFTLFKWLDYITRH